MVVSVVMIVIIDMSLMVMVVVMMVCVVNIRSQMVNGIDVYTIAPINHFNYSVNVSHNVLCTQELIAYMLFIRR
jgi:hypothetical protein